MAQTHFMCYSLENIKQVGAVFNEASIIYLLNGQHIEKASVVPTLIAVAIGMQYIQFILF